MDSQKIQRLAQLASQLTETLMTAVICAQEIRSEIDAGNDGRDLRDVGHAVDGPRRHSTGKIHRPLLDQTTLHVSWNGKSLHLGHTRLSTCRSDRQPDFPRVLCR
jgi:hypothetical protein